MSKYIVKNCPVCEFSDWEECTGYFAEGYICNDIHTEIVECQDCTDCVPKHIVELCRNIDCPCEYQGADCWECSRIGAKTFADKILKLLDIEEIE